MDKAFCFVDSSSHVYFYNASQGVGFSKKKMEEKGMKTLESFLEMKIRMKSGVKLIPDFRVAVQSNRR